MVWQAIDAQEHKLVDEHFQQNLNVAWGMQQAARAKVDIISSWASRCIQTRAKTKLLNRLCRHHCQTLEPRHTFTHLAFRQKQLAET